MENCIRREIGRVAQLLRGWPPAQESAPVKREIPSPRSEVVRTLALYQRVATSQPWLDSGSSGLAAVWRSSRACVRTPSESFPIHERDWFAMTESPLLQMGFILGIQKEQRSRDLTSLSHLRSCRYHLRIKCQLHINTDDSFHQHVEM